MAVSVSGPRPTVDLESVSYGCRCLTGRSEFETDDLIVVAKRRPTRLGQGCQKTANTDRAKDVLLGWTRYNHRPASHGNSFRPDNLIAGAMAGQVEKTGHIWLTLLRAHRIGRYLHRAPLSAQLPLFTGPLPVSVLNVIRESIAKQ